MTETTLHKIYDPASLESHWYQIWESRGYFAPSGTGTPFSIMIPPPNVTGSLHMGHAFQDTIMDALIRYHRMLGDDTLWQVGTDHAGIATQMLVERQLAAEGVSRHDLGRDAFLEAVWKWKDTSGGMITQQLRRMGASVDWSRERFTMDDGCSRAVQEVFIRLYDEGLIYRGQRLVNWDPVLHTAISDLEVVSEEEQGSLWHFRYPLTSGDGHLVVATTRPETMLGDTAVAVHPEDARYQHLIGQTITLPLVGREIPIIADDYVDPEFGTGCVKITPAHDFNDYAMGERHQLPVINIMTLDAHLNETVPEPYRGLDRFDARAQIIADLDALGLLAGIDAHTLKVPRGDRSGVVIEPLLTDQWFVAVESLAKPAIAAVESGAIQFVPKQWENTYFAWMRDLKDWCISRQLWWGHRIPAFYDDQGQIYVGANEDAVRLKYGLPASMTLHQDDDVLDTWFSSALWTFSTLGWPDETPELARYHPTSVLVTGFDIIFFWVARMIMMTLKFTGEVPFKTVYVHGLVRDADGQKMSKSKGNVLDPIDLIDGITLEDLVAKRTKSLMQPKKKAAIEAATRRQFPNGLEAYGTDALRFTFCSLASTGRDINFDVGRIEGYRNFCNKLWNASRFVLMRLEDGPVALDAHAERTVFDRWIVSRLQETEHKIAESFGQYRLDLAAQALYEFVWHHYCDWYLELTKPILAESGASPSTQAATRGTLVRVLETILRLAHPMMPYITEALWQQVAPLAGTQGATISQAPYPIAQPERADPEATADVEWLQSIIIAVRTIRGELNVSPGKAVPLMIRGGSVMDLERLTRLEPLLVPLAKLTAITNLAADTEVPPAASQLIGHLELMVPMAGLIDVAAERVRLEKMRSKYLAEIEGVTRKLGNPGFADKAPPEVVQREQDRLTEARIQLENTMTQLEALTDLA
ncbi:MAG: valine--tRNA ligase [Litorivicinaceae bacterium]|nr:valine--tRNA ligase [Litorivicinaceae bacterium]